MRCPKTKVNKLIIQIRILFSIIFAGCCKQNLIFKIIEFVYEIFIKFVALRVFFPDFFESSRFDIGWKIYDQKSDCCAEELQRWIFSLCNSLILSFLYSISLIKLINFYFIIFISWNIIKTNKTKIIALKTYWNRWN